MRDYMWGWQGRNEIDLLFQNMYRDAIIQSDDSKWYFAWI